MEIQFSNNFALFERISGNRVIDDGRVGRLIQQIQLGIDLLDSSPIKVYEEDGKLKIIDGQHRYMACVRMERPVPYVVVPKMTIHEIAMLNKNQKAWSLADYVDAYCEQGIESYLKLRSFAIANGMDYASATDFIGPTRGSKNGSSSNSTDSMRNGTWKVTRYEFGIEKAKQYREFCAWFSCKTRHFRNAFFVVVRTEGYDHATMRSRVQSWKKELVRKNAREEWLRYFEEIYNNGTRAENRVRFF